MHIALLTLAIAIIAQEQPAIRPPKGAVAEHLRYPEGYKPAQGGSYIHLAIPRAIDVEEWRHYGEVLVLSDAQRVALEAPYDRYRQADWSLRLNRAQPLWERSAEIAALGNSNTNSATAAMLAALFEESASLEPAIDNLESQFLSEVMSVLADDQAPRLDIVQMRRQRLRAQETRSPFPGHTFDLDEIIFEMRRRGVDITPRNHATFDGLMATWRAAATGLHQRHAVLARKANAEGVAYQARLTEMAAQAGGATPDVVAYADKHRRFGEAPTQVARKLHDLNGEYVALVAAELPIDAAAHLRRQFENEAFRGLSPDPADISSVFRAIDRLTLSREQQAAIHDIRVESDAVQAITRDRMKRTYLAWNEETWAKRGFLRDDYAKYSQEMQQLSQARIEKSKTVLASIQQALGDDQRAAIEDDIAMWHAWLDGFKKRQQSSIERFKGWPGPYE